MADSTQMKEDVAKKFASYPDWVKPKMLHLRQLALDCVGELDIVSIEEALKWGEPSFLAKHGSTLRMDWKARSPDKIGLYFNCNSCLVATFQELYSELFEFEGKRALLLDANQPFQNPQIQHCMVLALTYHKRKHLPLLGA